MQIAALVTLVKRMEETRVLAIHQSIRVSDVPWLVPSRQMEDGAQRVVVRIFLLLFFV